MVDERNSLWFSDLLVLSNITCFYPGIWYLEMYQTLDIRNPLELIILLLLLYIDIYFVNVFLRNCFFFYHRVWEENESAPLKGSPCVIAGERKAESGRTRKFYENVKWPTQEKNTKTADGDIYVSKYRWRINVHSTIMVYRKQMSSWQFLQSEESFMFWVNMFLRPPRKAHVVKLV